MFESFFSHKNIILNVSGDGCRGGGKNFFAQILQKFHFLLFSNQKLKINIFHVLFDVKNTFKIFFLSETNRKGMFDLEAFMINL